MGTRGRKKREVLPFLEMQKYCYGKLQRGETLTQDECVFVVDVDDKGTKPTAENHLTKMSIHNIEKRALAKFRTALGEKFNLHSLGDVADLTVSRRSAKIIDLGKK